MDVPAVAAEGAALAHEGKCQLALATREHRKLAVSSSRGDWTFVTTIRRSIAT